MRERLLFKFPIAPSVRVGSVAANSVRSREAGESIPFPMAAIGQLPSRVPAQGKTVRFSCEARELLPSEPEDADLTGSKRSLERRTMGLNVTYPANAGRMSPSPALGVWPTMIEHQKSA